MDFFSGREYKNENEPVTKPSQDQPPVTGPEPKNDSASSMTMDFFATERPQEEKETPGRTLGAYFAERADDRKTEEAKNEPGDESDWFPKEEPMGAYQPLSFGFEDEDDTQGAPMTGTFFDIPQEPAAQKKENQAPASFEIKTEAEAKSTEQPADEAFDFGILEKDLDTSMKQFDFAADNQETPKKGFDFDAFEKNMAQSTEAQFDFASFPASDDKTRKQEAQTAPTVSFDLPDEPQDDPFDFGASDPFSIGSREAADATVAFEFGSAAKNAVPESNEPTRVTPVPAENPAPERPDALRGYQPLSFGFEEEKPAEKKTVPAAAVPQEEAPRITPVPPAPEMPKRPAAQPVQPAASVPQTPAFAPQAPAPAPQAPVKPLPVKPISAAKDEPTLSFTPVGVKKNEEEPTVAFTPIGTAPQTAAKPAAPAAPAAPTAPVQSAAKPAPARSEKEKDIGAAVFSALMAEDKKNSAGETVSQIPNPMPPRRSPKKQTTPQPIDWHALDSAIEQTAAPEAASAEKQDFAAENATPINFDLNEFDSGETDVPDFGGADLFNTDAETNSFGDMFDQDPDEERTDTRQTRRRAEPEQGMRAPQGSRPRKAAPRSKTRRPNNGIFAWLALIVVALAVVLFVVLTGGDDEEKKPSSSGSGVPSASDSGTASESAPAEPGSETESGDSSVVPTDAIPREEWYMVLANRSSVLPADFAVETVKVGGVEVDARIAEPLKNMIDAAAAEGVKLQPVIGYRSMKWQTEKWNARVENLMKEKNLSKEEAEKKAIDFTSAPGTSDHNTGLGLDIVSEDHTNRDAAFADSKGAKWLAEHAVQYGFILRYPSDKTAETGMDYEPWHYRYVGPEQALKIKESGLCLEEYLK